MPGIFLNIRSYSLKNSFLNTRKVTLSNSCRFVTQKRNVHTLHRGALLFFISVHWTQTASLISSSVSFVAFFAQQHKDKWHAEDIY